MKRLFEFGFYCFYNLVVKKEGDMSHERASFGYAISSTFYIMAIFLWCLKIFKIGFGFSKIAFIAFCLIIGILIVFTFSRYFVKSNKYLDIERKYQDKQKYYKVLCSVFAFIYLFSSFFIFGLSALALSRV